MAWFAWLGSAPVRRGIPSTYVLIIPKHARRETVRHQSFKMAVEPQRHPPCSGKCAAGKAAVTLN